MRELRLDHPTQVAIRDLAEVIRALGGRAIVVGGAVRDMVFQRVSGLEAPVTDIDVEVFRVDPDRLVSMLDQRYSIVGVGGEFGVWTIEGGAGVGSIDVSLPRRERRTGHGHRDFVVDVDPHLSFADAAQRRDFTIGAMGFDPITEEILDPFHGERDLEGRILRHVGPAFIEDPLRPLRAVRFAARFGLQLAPATAALCRDMRGDATALPEERIWTEFSKTLLQAPRPGSALHLLEDIGWVDIFPEVAAMRGVPQDPRWHPEGDVFVHTAHVMDFWSEHLRTGDQDDDLIVIVAALCHDLGKVGTTEEIDGRIRAHGHDSAGVRPTSAFLERFHQARLTAEVTPLVEHHLAPPVFMRQRVTDRAIRKLSTKVSRLDLLCALARADQGGRPPLDPSAALQDIDAFEARVSALGVLEGPPRRLASGDHLIEMGLRPGTRFREILDLAYEAQLAGDVTTEDEARTHLAVIVEDFGIVPPAPPGSETT